MRLVLAMRELGKYEVMLGQGCIHLCLAFFRTWASADHTRIYYRADRIRRYAGSYGVLDYWSSKLCLFWGVILRDFLHNANTELAAILTKYGVSAISLNLIGHGQFSSGLSLSNDCTYIQSSTYRDHAKPNMALLSIGRRMNNCIETKFEEL